MKTKSLFLAVVAFVSAVGCGSGGDADKTVAPAATATSSPSAPPIAATPQGQDATAKADGP